MSFQLGILDLTSPLFAVEVATRAEAAGYSRYWVTEHHGAGASSGSPEILATLVAGSTERIRVGVAGILLLFHSPLKVAEDFRMLELFFPERMDLGLARGIAGPAATKVLLDGRPAPDASTFGEKVEALQRIVTGRFPPGDPLGQVGAAPAAAVDVSAPEMWVLGSGARSAELAARLGMRLCVGEHLNANRGDRASGPEAARLYRERFQPRPELPEPRWCVSVAGVCAETEEDALALVPPGDGVPSMLGSPAQCRDQLAELARRFETEEIIFADVCLELAPKLRSYELLAEAVGLRAGARGGHA